MTQDDSHQAEIAESILEHAQSIARLDFDMGAAAYNAAYATHVRAMRLLAVPHMDPQPDRGLVRNLRNLSANFQGVYVQMLDGTIQLILDAGTRQHKVNLWNRRQLLKNQEAGELDGE